ncbi:MAG: hypothetical protein ACLQU2_27955 [Candidatus Binataceae bacterium]
MNMDYFSITGSLEKTEWDLPDIRGNVPEGELPLRVEAQFDSQRYHPEHKATTLKLKRLATF